MEGAVTLSTVVEFSNLGQFICVARPRNLQRCGLMQKLIHHSFFSSAASLRFPAQTLLNWTLFSKHLFAVMLHTGCFYSKKYLQDIKTSLGLQFQASYFPFKEMMACFYLHFPVCPFTVSITSCYCPAPPCQDR